MKLTDEEVAVYKRLDEARLRLSQLDSANTLGLTLRERAEWELAYDLAIRAKLAAQDEWARIVAKASHVIEVKGL